MSSSAKLLRLSAARGRQHVDEAKAIGEIGLAKPKQREELMTKSLLRLATKNCPAHQGRNKPAPPAFIAVLCQIVPRHHAWHTSCLHYEFHEELGQLGSEHTTASHGRVDDAFGHVHSPALFQKEQYIETADRSKGQDLQK